MTGSLFVRDFTLPRDASSPAHVLVISPTDDATTALESARTALERTPFARQAKALDAASSTVSDAGDLYGAARILRATPDLLAAVDLTRDPELGDRLFRAGIAFVVDTGVWAIPAEGDAPRGLFGRGSSAGRQAWLTQLLDASSDQQDFRTAAVRSAAGDVSDRRGFTIVTKSGDGAEALVNGRQSRGNGVSTVDLGRVMRIAGFGGGAKAMGTRVSVSTDRENWLALRGDLTKSVMRPRGEVRARYVQVTGTIDPIEVRVQLLDTYSRLQQKVVVAEATGDLEQRLTAVLRAVRLAGLLGLDADIRWSDEGDVPPAAEVFEPEWLEAHTEPEPSPALVPLARASAPRTAEQLAVALVPLNGFTVDAAPLSTAVVADDIDAPYAAELASIAFAPAFAAAQKPLLERLAG